MAPWTGRRLAAANYVLDPNGTPLPVGRDWAARPLEFPVPNPPIRSIPRGMPLPIPSIADAEKQRRTPKRDSGANITAKEPQENVDQPTVTRAPIIPEEIPFHLDDPIADAAAQVRLGKHTHEPVRHTPKGNLPATPISGDEQLN